MIKRTFLIIPVILFCATLPAADAATDDTTARIILQPAEKLVEEAPLADSADPAYNRRLALKYLVALNKAATVENTRIFIEQAEKLFSLNVNDTQVREKYYQVLTDQARKKPDSEIAEKIRSLTSDKRFVSNAELIPPSTVEALQMLSQAPADQENNLVRLKLYEGITENPGYMTTYLHLHDIYSSQGNGLLAENILKQAQNAALDEFGYYTSIGKFYLDKARQSSQCFIEERDNLSKSLQFYMKINARDFANPDIYRLRASLHKWLGNMDEYISNAKKYQELTNSDASLDFYIYSLFWQDVEKARVLINRYYGDNAENGPILKLLINAYLIDGEWNKALYISTRYRELSQQQNFYLLLREYLLLNKLVDAAAAGKFMQKHLSNIKLSKWQTSLRNFHAGKISEQDLLQLSDDSCKKTEASFYIGFDHWVKGDQAQAREYLTQTVMQGHPAFLEFLIAKKILNDDKPKQEQ